MIGSGTKSATLDQFLPKDVETQAKALDRASVSVTYH